MLVDLLVVLLETLEAILIALVPAALTLLHHQTQTAAATAAVTALHLLAATHPLLVAVALLPLQVAALQVAALQVAALQVAAPQAVLVDLLETLEAILIPITPVAALIQATALLHHPQTAAAATAPHLLVATHPLLVAVALLPLQVALQAVLVDSLVVLLETLEILEAILIPITPAALTQATAPPRHHPQTAVATAPHLLAATHPLLVAVALLPQQVVLVDLLAVLVDLLETLEAILIPTTPAALTQATAPPRHHPQTAVATAPHLLAATHLLLVAVLLLPLLVPLQVVLVALQEVKLALFPV